MSDLQVLIKELGILGWDEVAPVFFASWIAGVPSVLIGEPGAAKTTLQTRFARALGLKVEILDLQHLTPSRLLGIPNPDRLKEGLLEYVGGLIASHPDVVILEEINRCHDSTQSLILEFLREGRLDKYYIKCKRMASCNPPGVNSLVGVHYLDYAQATRMVHIQVPNLSSTLASTFIDNWNLDWAPDKETSDMCKHVHNLKPGQPPQEILKSIALSLISNLNEYKISGRQIDTLLRLLCASWTLEQEGLHTFNAHDLGRLATSVIPLTLCKTPWTIKPEFLEVQVAKGLPEFPWQQELQKTSTNVSTLIEQAQRKYSAMEIEDILPNIKGKGPDHFIAFEILLQKITKSAAWNKPFDNFISM